MFIVSEVKLFYLEIDKLLQVILADPLAHSYLILNEKLLQQLQENDTLLNVAHIKLLFRGVFFFTFWLSFMWEMLTQSAQWMLCAEVELHVLVLKCTTM